MNTKELIAAQRFAEGLAKNAGKILLQRFGKSRIKVQKGKSDFATDADLASEKFILKEIKKRYPTHAILAEESGNHRDSKWQWVIDPLDGTKNFHFGLPFWCVSIALQHKGKTKVGVIFAPIVNQIFSARKGGGSYLNGKKIKVSANNKISEALIVTEIPRKHTSGKNFEKDVRDFTAVLKHVKRVRAFAAAAYDLCLVARGAADGYLDFSRNTKTWDVAAGSLIVKEAGGKIADVTLPGLPKNTVSVLASNAKLYSKFRKLI
jgi:myo-inositol-1(or 4)-monophosphatase